MRTLCLIRKGNVANLKGNFELSYSNNGSNNLLGYY